MYLHQIKLNKILAMILSYKIQGFFLFKELNLIICPTNY